MSRISKPASMIKQPSHDMIGISLIVGYGLLILWVLFNVIVPKQTKRQSQSLQQITKRLEANSQYYDVIVSSFPEYEQCVRIPVERQGDVSIGYPFCSNLAASLENQSFKIADSFTIPAEMPKRFHFWKKVYSKWSSQQFIVHSASYPEVVFEIIELADPDDYHHGQKWKKVKRIFEDNRLKYRMLLRQMHAKRKTADKDFTPAMARIATLMEHISDENKYLVAALNIRAQRGQKDFVRSGFENSTRYMEHIHSIFAEQGVPRELAYLAFVESSFNLKALSKVGASGVYQIMPETGEQYLRVSPEIDERNDPIKAAKAAAKLLKLNYKLTGSWPLAVISYNHGSGSVRRAIRAVGSTDVSRIVRGYQDKSFGFASQNFYFEYLAMLYTVLSSEKVFDGLQPRPLMAYKEVRIQKPTPVASIYRQFRTDSSTVKDFNPDLSSKFIREGGTLPKGFVLKLPEPSMVTAN